MKNGRNTAGKFTSGNTGRPKGARNKKTLAIDILLESCVRFNGFKSN